MEKQAKDIEIRARIPAYLHKDLTERAGQNERTIGQEIRLALKLYMAKVEK